MKILHLIHKIQNRGAETFACQLANHQMKQGHQVKIVCLYNGSAKLPCDSEITVLHSNVSLRFFDIAGWKKISKVINSFQPNLVQANAGDTLKAAIFSKLLFRWKVPVIFRNASEIGRYMTSPFQKKYNSFLFSKTDFIVSVSDASKKDIIEYFPFLKNKIAMIPIGLEEISSIASLNFKPPEHQHIIHIGGFTFEKNHVELIEIFDRIYKENKKVHLHLIGDGPQKNRVEKIVKEKNLNDHIHFYGFLNNPLSYLKAADVLVLPSIIEGLPGVILEAMYCKTPVVAYNVGGISEILNDETGFIIPKGDVEKFKYAVENILVNFPEKKVENAFKLVNRNYMNYKIAEEFSKVYKRVIDAREHH